MTVLELLDYAILKPAIVGWNLYSNGPSLAEYMEQIKNESDNNELIKCIKLVANASIGCIAGLIDSGTISAVEAKMLGEAVDKRTNKKRYKELLELYSYLDSLLGIMVDELDEVKESAKTELAKAVTIGHKRKVKNAIDKMSDEDFEAFNNKVAQLAKKKLLEEYCGDNDPDKGYNTFSPKFYKEVTERFGESAPFIGILTCALGVPDMTWNYMEAKRKWRFDRIQHLNEINAPKTIIDCEFRLLYELQMWTLVSSHAMNKPDLSAVFELCDGFVETMGKLWDEAYDIDEEGVIKPKREDGADFTPIKTLLNRFAIKTQAVLQ